MSIKMEAKWIHKVQDLHENAVRSHLYTNFQIPTFYEINRLQLTFSTI